MWCGDEPTITNSMGWKKNKTIQQKESFGIKIGCWNKGGALQPLSEKLNEIEILIKENDFSVSGVLEANFFSHNSKEDIEIDGCELIWDKGRENLRRNNSRSVLYIRRDLSFKVRHDLMEKNIPEIWVEIGQCNKKRSLLCL